MNKNFYIFYIFILLFLTGSVSFAQLIDADRSILDQNNLPGFIKEKKVGIESPYSKNYYLSSLWQVGSVTFTNEQMLDNVLLKYDVVKHIVEIKDDNETYMVSANSVKNFTWFNNEVSHFENFESTRNFYDLPEPLFGFLEVIVEKQIGLDEYKVLAYHDVWLYQANTSVSLSGSHRSNDIFWKDKFYFFKNGEMIVIPQKRKENYASFDPYVREMKEFIRSNGLYFRSSEDLSMIYGEYFRLISINSNF